ncbi:MAG TPA: hypothetical protein VND65_07410 [Candidatus Binatia bacterium]|nr:hypothetical protein [Candidatus Binatia bacterium]
MRASAKQLAKIVAASFLGIATAGAQSTLHIGTGAGTKCAEGCAGDPNLLAGARSVSIYQTSNGASTLSQPVVIILGVPSQYDSLMPTMPITKLVSINSYPGGTVQTGTFSYAAGGTYGLINPISDGYFGTMAAGQDVYSFLGLSHANNSNSFTNWSEEDEEYLDLTVTTFSIHVYALNADLGPDGLLNVSLVHNVPKGTYIVAYGENGKSFATPFTEAGLKCSY